MISITYLGLFLRKVHKMYMKTYPIYLRFDTKATHLKYKALFTWRQGAPANRATRLKGLKHSPPLHATHLSEIVGRAAANHNKQDGGQQKRFGGKLNFFNHSFR